MWPEELDARRTPRAQRENASTASPPCLLAKTCLPWKTRLLQDADSTFPLRREVLISFCWAPFQRSVREAYDLSLQDSTERGEGDERTSWTEMGADVCVQPATGTQARYLWKCNCRDKLAGYLSQPNSWHETPGAQRFWINSGWYKGDESCSIHVGASSDNAQRRHDRLWPWPYHNPSQPTCT